MSKSIMPFLILLVPFYLNDFLFIKFGDDFYQTITIDYTTRIIVLFGAVWLYRAQELAKEDLGITNLPWGTFLKWSILLSLVGVLIDRTVGVNLYPLMSEWVLFQFPESPSPLMSTIDLTLGVTMVAVSEEIAFRGFLVTWLRNRDLSRAFIVTSSSIMFGLMHWASGPHSVINAAVWAIILTLFVLKHRSIFPVIVAHYVTDLVAYSYYYLK